MANPILDRLKPAKVTETAVEQTAAAASSVDAATQEIVSAVDTAYKADSVIKSAQNVADLKAQQANTNVLQAAGGHAAQVDLMARLTEDENKVAKLLDKQSETFATEITGIGIIDGIINSFRNADTLMQLQTAAAERNQTLNQIKNTAIAQESIAKVNNQFKESLTTASIAAESEKMEAQAREMKNKALVDAAKTNALMMSELQQMSSRDRQLQIDSLRLEDAVEQRGIRKLELELTKEQIAMQRERMPLELQSLRATVTNQELTNEQKVKAAEDLEVLETTYTERVNLAEANLGKTKLSTRQEVMQALSMGGEAAETYWAMVTAGTTGNKGATPADSIEYLRKVDPRGQIPENKGTQLLQKFAELQIAEEVQTGVVAKDLAAKKAAINRVADQYMQESEKKIVHGTGNPFEAPPLSALAPMLESAKIPLYDKVIKEKGMVDTNPQAIIDSAAEAVLAKRISTAEAVQGIKDIFNTAVLANNIMPGGFRDIGVDDQRSYFTPVKKLAGSLTAISGTYTSAAKVPFNVLVAGKSQEDAAKILASDIYSAAVKTEVLNLLDTANVEKALANAVTRIRKGEQN